MMATHIEMTNGIGWMKKSVTTLRKQLLQKKNHNHHQS